MFRILIAEDDPSTARLLTAILKREGFEPLTAADGVQALEMLDHNHIDLLLCDVMMPRMDGFALTKAIRDSGSMLPILMLTAKDMPQDKHTGFIVGTDDYMTKPPDRQELVLRIRALLRRARIVDEHKITIGEVELDYDTHTVRRGHEAQVLPPKDLRCRSTGGNPAAGALRRSRWRRSLPGSGCGPLAAWGCGCTAGRGPDGTTGAGRRSPCRRRASSRRETLPGNSPGALWSLRANSRFPLRGVLQKGPPDFHTR